MKLNRRYLNKNISKEDTIYKAQHTPHTDTPDIYINL